MEKYPAVDQDTCVGCESCVAICPDVFEMGHKDKAFVKNAGACKSCNCQEAIDICPVNAISWSED